MTRSLPLVIGCSALFVLGSGQPAGSDSQQSASLRFAATPQVLRDTSAPFIPNLGQWDNPARFLHRSGAMSMLLEDRGWMLVLAEQPEVQEQPFGGLRARTDDSGAAEVRCLGLRMSFEGATQAPRLVAEARLPGHHNYLVGDRSDWRTDVPLYAAVRYGDLYPGVDLRVRQRDGHPEYDLLLRPRADLDAVQVHVEGADGLRIEDDGTLVIDTALGPITQEIPHTWQEAAGGHAAVPCRYVLRGPDRFGFEAPDWDRELALVIDPGLLWSTYLGGGGAEDVNSVATASNGHVFVCGQAVDNDFPTTVGAYNRSYGGANDGYVSRFDPSKSNAAQLVYSTYFGGNRNDSVLDFHVDANDALTITGFTESSNLPTTPGAFASSIVGDMEAFVACIDPGLSGAAQLVYSTFLGGTERDRGLQLSVNASGVIAVAGETSSPDFPVTSDAFNPSYRLDDIFIACIDPTLTGNAQLTYSTFAGGTDIETTNGLHISAKGIVTFVGQTLSVDYPTSVGSLNQFYQGGAEDGYVSQLDPSRIGKAQMVYSSFIGGNNRDHVLALDVHETGLIAIAGWTWSSDFMTTPGAWDRGLGGFSDSFVCLIAPFPIGPSQLVYSTLLGGSGHEQAYTVAIHSNLVITTAGETRSLDFPTTKGAYASQLVGSGATPPADCWIARFDGTQKSTNQLVYSTLLGGDTTDTVQAITVDRTGAAIIGVQARSNNFPLTPQAFQTKRQGNRDAVLTMLDMLPDGVTRYGTGSAGCDGHRAISVTSLPSVGNADFAITASNGPIRAQGLLVIGGAALQTPMTIGTMDLWVQPSVGAVAVPVVSDPYGATRVAMGIPPESALVGGSIFAQYLWIDVTSAFPTCPPLGGSATLGLQIEIQP